MGKDSGIQWTHHTFNPWRGCTHVSPGCEHCYAETLSKRNPAQLGTWGAGGTRVIAAESYWAQPFRWDKAAAAAGERHRVFCASLADVFEDRPELREPRHRLWSTIVATPHLDWLLLTKRPENAVPLTLGWLWPRNVWLGATIEDQRRADERQDHLRRTPAGVRFVSYEPALTAIDWTGWEWLDWMIVGGESGPQARRFDLAWARDAIAWCAAHEVACFIKQLGTAWSKEWTRASAEQARYHRHGGDPDEWPADLRVREFPDSHPGLGGEG